MRLLVRGDRLCIFTARCLSIFRSANSSLICLSMVMVIARAWYQMGSEECLFTAHSHFSGFRPSEAGGNPHTYVQQSFLCPTKLTHTLSSPLNMQSECLKCLRENQSHRLSRKVTPRSHQLEPFELNRTRRPWQGD